MKSVVSSIKLLLISIIVNGSIHAMEIINNTNSPKTVEILEYRPVEGGTFGCVILEAELQPGELRSFNYTYPELLVEVKWGTRYEIPDDKFMVRESEPSRVARWQKVGDESVVPRMLKSYPIVIPPNTIVNPNPDGTTTYQFAPGKKVEYDPHKELSMLEFIIKKIPYRLINKIIIEKVPSPIVTFTNRRAVHVTVPKRNLDAPSTSSQRDQLIIVQSDDNTVTLQVQYGRR